MMKNIRYKKTVAVALIVGIPMLFANFTTKYIKVSGAHPGSTGAPGDGTCADAGCHAGVVNTNVVGINTLNFPSSDSTYIPGQTYTMSLNVKKSAITRFGFEIVALKDGANTNVGTWTITEATRTQQITHTVSGNVRKSLTHKSAGTTTTTPGETTWTFKWTAPATDQGNITFYFASNCTNNDTKNSGDAIYTNSFKIHPDLGNSISAYLNEQESKIYFNSTEIVFDYTLKVDKKVVIRLADALGRTVLEQQATSHSLGKNIERLTIEDNINKGIYFASLIVDGRAMTEKIIVQ